MNKNTWHVLVIDDDVEILILIKTLLESKGYKVTTAQSGEEGLEQLKEKIPQLIILDVVMPGMSGYEVCKVIRKDPVLKYIPIIMLTVKDSLEDKIRGWRLGIDEYKIKPFNPEELSAIVDTLIYRAYLGLDANPLTRFPGNNSIAEEINKRMKDRNPFAVCFIDMDNFKAFNDHYGFEKGDEVIKLTAAVIREAVQHLGSEKDFIGHIGGDDFVLITTPNKVDLLCQKIIKDFDQIIPELYSKKERKRGYIIAHNRRGEKEEFPIMTISIGVVTNKEKELTHLAQVSALGTELKEYAKTFFGSNYVVDRRKKEEKVIKKSDLLFKKKRILIVDDDHDFSSILSLFLKKEGYHITAVQNGASALSEIKKKWFNVVLLDIKLPDISGIEVLKRIKEKTPETIVIIMTAFSTMELAIDSLRYGAYDYLQKEVDLEKVSVIIKRGIEKQRLEIKNKDLIKSLTKKIDEVLNLNKALQSLYLGAMSTLVRTMEAKDHYLKGHSHRVTNYAVAIAKELKLSEGNQELIRYTSQLHDIGKIGIRDFILHKLEKLTEEEWDEIKLHPTTAANILKPLGFLKDGIPTIKHHHERYDGNGYPEGLKRDNIPLGARIIAVADAFDAMTSDRAYRKAKSVEQAIEELKKHSGSQFDPIVVEAFLKVLVKNKDSMQNVDINC